MIQIVVDSSADLAPDVAAAAGITVVSLLIQFGATTHKDTELSHDAFYTQLVASPEIPHTAAPPIGFYEEAFRTLTANGDSVFSISLAEQLSATYSAARQAAELVEDAEIVCVESGTVAAGHGYIALAAAAAARAGASLGELTALVAALRPKPVLCIGLDTLRYLEKGGRIGRMRAFLGTMLNVKPILEVREGVVLPVEQVRTSKRMPGRMFEIARDRGRFAHLAILYTTDRAAAEAIAAQCAAAGFVEHNAVDVIQAGPALGTHVGPGALGFAGLLA